MERSFKIITEKKFGYKRIDPIPSKEEIKKYYKEQYYKYLLESNNTQEAKLLNEENIEKNTEFEWLKNTYYKDSKETLERLLNANKYRMLDIGCGDGRYIKYMQKLGWNVVGIEPSDIAYKKAKERDLEVYNCTIEEFIENKKDALSKKFDVINITGVLELVSEPVKILKICNKLLEKEGIIRIQALNEFNVLQETASEKLDIDKWWISYPDHLNYFNKESLRKLMEYCGFAVKYLTTDFPMEMFLLMGYNYVGNPDIGRKCHEARMNFEETLDDTNRRILYEALSDIGIGRNIIMYGEKI